MNLASHPFSPVWLWFLAAVAVAALIHAVRVAPWRSLASPLRLHLWLGAVVLTMVMWLMDASVATGLSLHLLGSSALTLVFGPALGFVAVAIALGGSAINGGVAWAALGLNLLVMGALPVLLTMRMQALVERRLPANFFIYIFVLAFAGSGLGVVLVGVAATLALWLAGAYPLVQLLDEYLPFFVLLAFSEAWLTGMLMTLLVIYRKGWVASFDDQRYLTRKPTIRIEMDRSNKQEKDTHE